MKKIKSTSMKEVGVTNNPNVKKRMMITAEDFGNIMSFGRAIFTPNQSASAHVHPDMKEVFFILPGNGVFHTKTENIKVEKDDFISISAGETHWQSNPFEESLDLLFFGVKVQRILRQ